MTLAYFPEHVWEGDNVPVKRQAAYIAELGPRGATRRVLCRFTRHATPEEGRLLAAAPDLLMACGHALGLLSALPCSCHPENGPCDRCETIPVLEAAIAKACGEAVIR